MRGEKSADYFDKLNYSEAPRLIISPPGPNASSLLDRQRVVDSHVLSYPYMIPLAPEAGRGATVGTSMATIT